MFWSDTECDEASGDYMKRIGATVSYGRRLLEVAGMLLLVSGCDGGTESASTEVPLLDVPSLAGESHLVLDAALGSPISIVPIENLPNQMPGEFRDYRIHGVPEPVTVRFHRDQAVFFTVYLPEPESSAEAALLRVGLDVRGTAPDTRAPMAQWWRTATVNGKHFRKAGALRGMGTGTDDFDMVQVDFQP
jgi:hypothetical protein